MKNLILPLIFTIVFSSILIAKDINDTQPSLQTAAYKVFKDKNYELAYKLYYKLFLNDLDNSTINFYLGRSAFELRQYDNALMAYERIMIKEPTTRVKLEIARCHFMQGSYYKSKQIFESIQKDKHPKGVAKNIDNYLKRIDKKIANNTFGGMFIIGAHYDSNINNRATSDNFYIPLYENIDGGIFENSTEDVSSASHQEILIFNHKYKLNYKTRIKNDLMFFNKDVTKYDNKDVKFISYVPALSYKHSNNLSIDYGFFIDRLWYGSDIYLDSYGILPKATYKYSKDLTINSFLKYQVKTNKLVENKLKDSKYLQFNLSANQAISSLSTFTPALVIEQERKDEGNLTNVDYNLVGLDLSLNYKYSQQINIIPKISYKNKKYKDIDPFYLVKQKNDEYTYSLTGIYMFNLGWVAQGIINYSDIDSNIISSKYEKYTVGINFIKPF